jgi:hypothetical protein
MTRDLKTPERWHEDAGVISQALFFARKLAAEHGTEAERASIKNANDRIRAWTMHHEFSASDIAEMDRLGRHD